MLLTIDAGVMPCSALYASWMARRRSVSAMRQLHRVGHPVRIHERLAVDVARGAADGLDQRAARAQESFLVGIENRHQRDLGEIEPFTQQVDADQDVELPLAQIAQDLDALERIDVRVQVADLDAELLVVLRQVLRHPLGERRHQHALAVSGAVANLREQVVHLAAHRAYFDDRVEETGRPDDLLDDDAARLTQLVRAGRGRDEQPLADPLLPLLEVQRPVVQRRRQAEPVRDQDFLARAVAVIHAADLRNGLVALVDDGQRVAGQIVEERRRRIARCAAGQVARVVLDAVAVANLLDHLQIEHRPLVQAVRLEHLPFALELSAIPGRAPP